jgi:hypothetical protein
MSALLRLSMLAHVKSLLLLIIGCSVSCQTPKRCPVGFDVVPTIQLGVVVGERALQGQDVAELSLWSYPPIRSTFVRGPLHEFRVENVRPSVGPYGHPGIVFDIIPADRSAFKAYTTTNVSRKVAFIAGGKVIMESTIAEPLGTRLHIWSELTEAQRDEILHVLCGSKHL